MVLKFELPNVRFLNVPKKSAAVLIRPVLIIGDCVYWQNSPATKSQIEHTVKQYCCEESSGRVKLGWAGGRTRVYKKSEDIFVVIAKLKKLKT